MDRLNAASNNYAPVTGIFGGYTTQGGYVPGAWVAFGSGNAPDSFEKTDKPEPEKRTPWYAKLGKEAVITGITVAASLGGFALGGLAGAMAAGAASSAVVNMLDQKFSRGKINWGSVTIDAALGLIPGFIGEALAKSGTRMLAQFTGKNLTLAAEGSLRRSLIVGATDGAVLGFVGNAAQSGYESYRETGKVQWGKANAEGARGIFSGALGGAAAGGIFKALNTRRPPNS